MGGLFGTVLAVLVAVAAGLHTVGTPGSACGKRAERLLFVVIWLIPCYQSRWLG